MKPLCGWCEQYPCCCFLSGNRNVRSKMESLGLLIGHLVGDYIVQDDWMAANKGNPNPGDPPNSVDMTLPEVRAWSIQYERWLIGHFACTFHCVMYTLAVWACSWWWMPWWGLAICFACHWPVDRYRLAGWWMRNVSGQSAFANGPLAPWSIIAVDNTFHLATLFVIGLLA